MGKKSKRKPSNRQVNNLKEPPPGGSGGGQFKIEDRVTLKDLNTKEFNGKSGTVVSLPVALDDSKRYGILIDGSQKPIAIQARNLVPNFKVGDHVVLHGLNTIKYNGMYGTIARLPEDSDASLRYAVRRGDGTTIGIQAKNLMLISRMSTQQQKEELDRMHSSIELPDNEAMNADQMAMMRTMMGMFLTEEHEIKLYGRKIIPMPDFRRELMTDGLPSGVNYKWANEYLRIAFEHASSLPHTFEMFFKQEEYEPDSRDYVKRLGTNDPRKLRW